MGQRCLPVCCVVIYPHQRRAFSQNVRPGVGSWPTNLEPGPSALRWLLGDDDADRLSASSSPSNHLSADGPGSRLLAHWPYNWKAAVTLMMSRADWKVRRMFCVDRCMIESIDLSYLGKARGRIELSMIVTYFQCLTLRIRSGHSRQCFNPGTLVAHWKARLKPPNQSQSVVDSFTYYKNTLQWSWPHFWPGQQCNR